MNTLHSKIHRGGLFLLLAFGFAVALPALSAAPEGKPDRAGRVGEPLKEMLAALELTANQKAQVREIMETQREKIQALRADDSQERREKMKAMRSLQEEGRLAIRAVLTPEQAKKFEAMPKPERGDRQPGGGK